MLVVCDQCQARYKITIAQTPGKAVTFKCGKCQHLIRLSPEQIEAGSAPATGVRPAAVKARPEKPASARTDAPSADSETVRGTCLKCGAAYVKPVSDKSTMCYQCRIDSLVNKVREKYGVAPGPEAAAPAPAPEAPAPVPEAPAEPPPEAASRYTIRSADGLVLGPIKFRTVSVLAREKRILGREEVSRDDGEFAPLMSFPELAELFPNLKEILDTDGLEDKVDEAFMAAFGADEGEGKAQRDAEETEAALAGLDAPAPEPTAPAAAPEPAPEPPPEPAADEGPSLGLEDLGGEEPAAPAEPPAKPAPEKTPPTEEAVEVEHSFKIDQTGPRPSVTPEPPARPEPPKPEPVKVTPPAKIVEKTPVVEKPAPALEPSPDEGTEFEVGEEWSEGEGGGEEEEIIEDLEAIEPPPDARYRIRYPDGLMLGPVKYGTIKELFASGNLTGQEEVQRDEGGWAPFTNLPELAVLMAEAEPAEDEVMELTDLLEEKS